MRNEFVSVGLVCDCCDPGQCSCAVGAGAGRISSASEYTVDVCKYWD